MRNNKTKTNAAKIKINCCNHKNKKNSYHYGFTGLKCCKVALCLDCDKVQFLGGWFSKIIYVFIRRAVRNRITIIETIEIKPFVDERWQNELEKYGRDKQ